MLERAVGYCDCPKARHIHGDYTMYNLHRCRCGECKHANKMQRRRHRAKGRTLPVPVDATPARHMMERLKREGFTYTMMADVSGVSEFRLWEIRKNEHYKVTPEILAAVVNLPNHIYRQPPLARLQATGTTRRLRALAVSGYTVDFLIQYTGLNKTTIARARKGEGNVSRETYDVVKETYRRLENRTPTWGVEGDEYQQARSINFGWHGPEAWRGVDMEHPDVMPRDIWTDRTLV